MRPDIEIIDSIFKGTLTWKEFQGILIRANSFMKSLVDRSRFDLCSDSGLLKPYDITEEKYNNMIQTTKHGHLFADFLNAIMIYLPWGLPDLILPLGFNQLRFTIQEIHDPEISPALEGIISEMMTGQTIDGGSLCPKCTDVASYILKNGIQFRSPNGVWHTSEFIYDLLLQGPRERASVEYWCNLMRDNWKRAVDKWDTATQETVVSLPELWSPEKDFGETLAHTAAIQIVRELSTNKISLKELHWRKLEELAAELLYDLGLEVIVTDRSGDGGRDVIARGELIPGEPSVFAVEVKQMPVVTIKELRQALWANRQFPALLFATSGRFSAGVIKESEKGDTHLRLILKDGLALRQWIDEYAKRRWQKGQRPGAH